jgi:predicted alpha-1,6-mannanase (GH76 family)
MGRHGDKRLGRPDFEGSVIIRADAITLFGGALIVLATYGAAGRAPAPTTTSPAASFRQMAAEGIAALQADWYNQQTGLWNTTGWWNAANSLTVLADYSKLTHSSQYLSAISNTFTVNSPSHFLNPYYDDEGWWALAWIASYDATRNLTYLNEASQIFANMTTGWDNTCGGGIWWNKNRRYKNAIANELFLSVAANLASRVADSAQRAADLSWAQKEWQWFLQSSMINGENLINDGLGPACRNNGKTTWTYNQGVVLGGLAALSADTHEPSLLSTAQSIALAAISHLTDSNSILHDPCEPHCGADGVQFKGIFARNLATLESAAPQSQYVTFLETNARSIWTNNRGNSDQFGLIWSGPFAAESPPNAATQTSAIDALLAATQASGE